MNYGVIAEQPSQVFNHLDGVEFFVDADVFYAPAITTTKTLHPGLVTDTDVFRAPSVFLALQFVDPPLVPSDDAEHAPRVATGLVTPVNNGTLSGNPGAVTSASVPLPASRTNGNVLVAWLQLFAGSETVAVGVPGGWTLVDQVSDASSSSAWAWRIVDGTEAAADFTWGSGSAWHGQVHQFTGNAASPVGNFGHDIGSGTTLSAGSINSSHDASLFLAIEMLTGLLGLPVPEHWKQIDIFADSFGSDIVTWQYASLSGDPSVAISATIPSTAWSSFVIELKAP